MRRQHMEEAKEAVQGTYSEILQKLNALITRGRCYALVTAIPRVECEKTLTSAQKQYILNKMWVAHGDYVDFLLRGWRFVWQLPAEMRDGAAYMYTFRYIRCIPTGQRQFRLLLKLIKMANHENNPDFLKSGYKKDLYEYTKRIFLKYCVK